MQKVQEKSGSNKDARGCRKALKRALFTELSCLATSRVCLGKSAMYQPANLGVVWHGMDSLGVRCTFVDK